MAFDNFFAYSLAGASATSGTGSSGSGSGSGSGGDPTTVAGLQLWVDATDASTITTSGTQVTQWDDKSGNGNNITSDLGSPQLGTDSVVFDGNDALTIDQPRFSGNEPRSVFISLNCDSGSDVLFAWSFGEFSSNALFSLRIDRDNDALHLFNHGAGGTNAPSGSFTIYDQYCVIQVDYNGTDCKIYLNNVELISNTYAYSTSNATGGLLGRGVPTGSSFPFFDGEIRDFVVYNSSLSASDRDTVYNYLASKI